MIHILKSLVQIVVELGKEKNMFNKEESNRKKEIKLNKGIKFVSIGAIVVTMSFLMTLSNAKVEESDTKKYVSKYESNIANYIRRQYEFSNEKTYDETVTTLYNDGIIIIDGMQYSLDNFYIDYNRNAPDFDLHLKCVGSGYKDISTKDKEDHEFTGCILFKDSTAFKELINNRDICDINANIIVIKNLNGLHDIVINWNGMIHDMVSNTDAINNKTILQRRQK